MDLNISFIFLPCLHNMWLANICYPNFWFRYYSFHMQLNLKLIIADQWLWYVPKFDGRKLLHLTRRENPCQVDSPWGTNQSQLCPYFTTIIISPLSNLLQYHNLFFIPYNIVSCLVLYTYFLFAPPPYSCYHGVKSLSHKIFVLCHRSRAYGNLYCMGGNPFHCYFFNIKAAAWLEEVFCPVNFFSCPVLYYI